MKREKKVYGLKLHTGWLFSETKTKNDTHEAIVYKVRKMKAKKECDHQPKIAEARYESLLETLEFVNNNKCRWCGKKLKLSWVEDDNA